MDYMDNQPRYLHCEGHVDLCFDESGDHILTCGQGKI